MAKYVKCKVCDKKVLKDKSFLYLYIKRTGKEGRLYYCNREEFHQSYMDKRYYNKTRLLVDKILGYTCINNEKNSMITRLYEFYTREVVYKCMKEYAESISKCLHENENIIQEFHKLRYIFAVVEKNIKDYSIGIIHKTNDGYGETIEDDIDDKFEYYIDDKSTSYSRRKNLKDRLVD